MNWVLLERKNFWQRGELMVQNNFLPEPMILVFLKIRKKLFHSGTKTAFLRMWCGRFENSNRMLSFVDFQPLAKVGTDIIQHRQFLRWKLSALLPIQNVFPIN